MNSVQIVFFHLLSEGKNKDYWELNSSTRMMMLVNQIQQFAPRQTRKTDSLEQQVNFKSKWNAMQVNKIQEKRKKISYLPHHLQGRSVIAVLVCILHEELLNAVLIKSQVVFTYC
ncbi:unnamed protein product [Paramecium octaurelia]|uniref:Uncharacterized protein n=1 Tax=Paramecium octaurelia TaxID=43137 RepID=A0A8S1YKA5_PAROT|nr:unnamed protein product [Paramecium octaurelia]